MPSVKLEGLNVTLRTMYHKQKCQYRYGKIDDESYPITKSNRAAAKKSLEWIASKDNEGVTWRRAGKDEFVFAYPSILPKIPVKYVSLLGDSQENPEQAELRFGLIAKPIIETLRGLPPKETPRNIHVFSIRKMDRARSKVVFNRNYAPEWLIGAAEEWEFGCEKNLPEMDIRAFPPKKPDDRENPLPRRIELTAPFPLQIPKIFNTVWKQDGETKASTKQMQYYQGIELLLDPPRETSLRYCLNILLSHSIGLVQYTGNQQHRGLADSNRRAREMGYVLSILGLLLHKCGYAKEDYMEHTAYLVGQLLKISDGLHALYCKIKRKGDVPPQLAGNSVFVTATETPIAALAQLGTRMNPYVSWAKQHRTKNEPDSKLAGWYLSLYEDTAAKLQPLLTDGTIRFNDFEKAQVFIGYLAAFPKNEKTGANEIRGSNDESDN
jgi:hypothetical protein